MHDDFQQLYADLSKIIGGRKVLYFPNPGNWGDGLIRAGTLQFFKDFKIPFKEVASIRRRYLVLPYLSQMVAVFGGGGAWCEFWDHSKYVVQLSRHLRTVVLPSSYGQAYDIPNTHFFRRDHFESLEAMPKSGFCHDLAFYLGTAKARHAQNGSGTGYYFREDIEGKYFQNLPKDNYDLSLKGTHLSEIEPFFEHINQYRVIHTDRLHVGIASSLLGKEVHLYAGNYFKNRAVFNTSIKNHFKNTHFHEDIRTG